MPGHKLGMGIPPEFTENICLLDLTEIPGTDNLHSPSGAIKEAQELAAGAFGADSTFFLVNGSTCGIHAMIMTLCKPGDKLIVSRDCHKSVIGGMMLAGVQPVYMNPGFNTEFGISTVITPSQVERSLELNPDAAGVLITRPNYYGICSDIREIAEVVHKYDRILAVDEAHGAHLKFSGKLPVCALQGGADMCVQSAHKTLPAFTQGAYLHVKSHRVELDKLKFNLSLLQTSSPSYVIMAFLDIAREIMVQCGTELLENLLGNIEKFRGEVQNIKGLKMLTAESIGQGTTDRTRMVINVGDMGVPGLAADKALRERYDIQVEMSDLRNIVCIATVSDTRKNFGRLSSALAEMAEEHRDPDASPGIPVRELGIPLQAVDLKDVIHLKSERCELRKAAGKVSKGSITPYPPGIPLVCPGEVISGDVIEYVYNFAGSGGIIQGIGENFDVEVIK